MTIRKENEIKQIQIKKEEVKLSLFADDMMLYIDQPKDNTRKLSELIRAVAAGLFHSNTRSEPHL